MVKTDIQDYWRHTWCGDKELPQDNAANGKSRLYGGEDEAAVVWAGDKVVYAKQRENLIKSMGGYSSGSKKTDLTLTAYIVGNASTNTYQDYNCQAISINDVVTISFDISDCTATSLSYFSLASESLKIPYAGVGHYHLTAKMIRAHASNVSLRLFQSDGTAWNETVKYCIVKNFKIEKNIVDTLYNVNSSVTDNRVKIGKHWYHTTQIGNLIWTAENLNEDLGGGTWEGYYGNDPSYGVKGYGKLYTWDAICKANETPSDVLAAILPAGWRVPTKTDFDALITSVGSSNITKLKEKWYCSTAGTNTTGFSALNCGDYITSGTFENVGTKDFIWCATQKTESISNYLLVYGSAGVYTQSKKTYAFSARLVRDAATATAIEPQALSEDE